MSFPKQIVIRSAVPGATVASRKVLDEVDSVDSTSLQFSSQGTLLNRNEYVHLFFKKTANSADTTFYVQVHWYSSVSEMWHKGERISINDNDISTMEIQGLSRIYLQVDDIVLGSGDAAGGPKLDAWIGLVVPV